MYETFGSHQNVTTGMETLFRHGRIAKMPVQAMTLKPITEEAKRDEAEVPQSYPFA
jgi:hypothetical protein